MRRGVGYINARAKSGYTTINVTRDTRELLEQLRREMFFKPSFDELLYDLTEKKLEEIRQRDSVEDAGVSNGISRSPDSIDQTPANAVDAGRG